MQLNAQSYSIIDISQSIRVESRGNNKGAAVLPGTILREPVNGTHAAKACYDVAKCVPSGGTRVRVLANTGLFGCGGEPE
jgi:hypothetical protein